MQAFDNREAEAYRDEAKEKWGNTDAYREHTWKTADYSEDKWKDLAQGMDQILAAFAACREEAPEQTEAQRLVGQLQDYITANYYHCTKEILAGLGQMYVADERFKSNIDRHSDGTASYISEAIKVYCAT
jgi:hypothetical protein